MKERRRANVAPIWAEIPKSAGGRDKNSMYLAHPLLNLHQLPVYPSSPLTQLDLPRVIDEDVGSLGTGEGIRSCQRTSFPRAPLLPHL